MNPMPPPELSEPTPKLSTKAATLAQLMGRLNTARILPLVRFSVFEWRTSPASIVDQIEAALGTADLIVRSSAAAEDRDSASLAGQFLSVAGVSGRPGLGQAIEQVIASYGDLASASDEVLVQAMLRNVVRSGVAFSMDPNTGSPYRVINYSESGDTSAVTGGGSALTFVHAFGAPVPPPAAMAPILALVEELEALLPETALDIEFATVAAASREEVVLLQVRPLVLTHPVEDTAAHQRRLAQIADKVDTGLRPHPFLHGKATVYGVMPDWNPAEIIGVRPRPLALSLYRELITDATWAYQRHNYGYKNLRSFPLLLHFHGLPYIDVRVSFNSFVPRDIDGSLADRLVDYYIDRLLNAPSLHDKVEFEIVFSCYSLDVRERLGILSDYAFSKRDQETVAESLRHLTNRIIHQESGLWRADRDKLATLAERRDQTLTADLDRLSRIYWLLEDCKRYGTLPFAGLARAGFIAVQMLRSLVATGVFSRADYDAFMGSLNTVSSQLARDMKHLDRTTFLSKYGHLRPGTYDILSPRYDEAPDRYFNWQQAASGEGAHGTAPFSLSLVQMRRISALLKEHGLETDVVGLFDFLQAGIELREYAKFVFTRNLSDAMALIRAEGESHGFSVDDLSYADIRTFYELHGSSADPRELIAQSIAQGRSRYRETASLWLPPLITRSDEVWSFHVPACEPNFITQKAVTAPVVGADERDRLAGAIVAIPSADPGYDWLFSHPIAGLITAYGGVNSHMAIRAGELGLPAVIGAGESLFTQWRQARQLMLNCAARQVIVLP